MERLLTIPELAERLQVKPRTIYQWVHEGYIPVLKLGALVRFSPARIGEWLRKRETPGRQTKRLDLDADRPAPRARPGYDFGGAPKIRRMISTQRPTRSAPAEPIPK